MQRRNGRPMRTLREIHRIGSSRLDLDEGNFAETIGKFRMWTKRCLTQLEVSKIWEERKKHMPDYITEMKKGTPPYIKRATEKRQERRVNEWFRERRRVERSESVQADET
ncbi:hypothetical protein TrLO_g11941 [Triparma laevis f. longispina]|uniref:Uncharacterized protein n=1 Tax=Triparma laevis f. longispina TaxID=1714387 RepID=A0A9W7FQP9_9STRA|nr:hypothetical protein TrLO_g11941 [Triparma laevis f. longispina]